jgi:hypothetical protein
MMFLLFYYIQYNRKGNERRNIAYRTDNEILQWYAYAERAEENSITMFNFLYIISRICTEGIINAEVTYLLTYGAEPFLRSCQLCSPSRTPQHFMEPEGSISCSQEPSTGPYPEPYPSNPLYPIISL